MDYFKTNLEDIHLEMSDITVVPYFTYGRKAFIPKLFKQFNTTFVYSLFSPINGSEIKRGDNFISLQLELVIPIGVLCFLKALHFEKDGKYVKDEQLDMGIVKLIDGQNHLINFDIPNDMPTSDLKRGDKIGSIIFDRSIDFRPFNIMSNYHISDV